MASDFSRPGTSFLLHALVCSAVLCLALPGIVYPLSAAPADKGTQQGNLHGYEAIQLGRGHFNRLFLTGTLDGHKGLLALATGHQFTTLSDKPFGALHPVSSLPDQSVLRDMNSEDGTHFKVAVTNDFKVGGVDLGQTPVRLEASRKFYDPDLQYERGRERQYDGLLAEDILRRYQAVIDCGRLLLYLHVGGGPKLNLGAALVQAGWTRVPMTDEGRMFTVPCSINQHNYRLIVTTSSPFTTLDTLKLTQAGSGARGVLAFPDYLQIGSYYTGHVHMMARRDLSKAINEHYQLEGGIPILGRLGGDILASENALIDLAGHALYLKRTPSMHKA